MSDDEYVNEELLALLKQSLASGSSPSTPEKNVVLEDAEFIYDNSIDVAMDMVSTKAAAELIYGRMQEQGFSTQSWANHELHPKEKNAATVDFIFTMDLLNFSFWPDDPNGEAFTVHYREKSWTGYSSVLAVLWRALDEGYPITSPGFWNNKGECTDEIMAHIFRSDSDASIPLRDERIAILRQTGELLCSTYSGSFSEYLEEAEQSALRLVRSLTTDFECFRDKARFEGRKVCFFKRAQILVADLWACFEGEGPGQFEDIDRLTMFPDYRVPQLLQALGCLQYSPSLESHIKAQRPMEPGHSWEVQLRGCSVWVVELIRRHILRQHPGVTINAILIDFFLYDTAKAREKEGAELMPHHRCRTIWY